MVQFKMTAGGGFEVLISYPKHSMKRIGYLMKGRGFVNDAQERYIESSADDLRVIALKAEEVKVYGSMIPICKECHGSPSNPSNILSPLGSIGCPHTIHDKPFRPVEKIPDN